MLTLKSLRLKSPAQTLLRGALALSLGALACTDDGGGAEAADAATETNDEGSCTPGTQGCECVESWCFGELICDAGVCVPPPDEEGSSTDAEGSEDETSSEDSSDSTDSTGSTDEESSSGTESEGSEDSSDSEDTGEPLTPCEEAAASRASIGCEYVMPILGIGNSSDQCEIAVVNPTPAAVATVYVEGYVDGAWEPLAAPFVLEPYDSDALLVSISPFRALRVSSDAPVAVLESLGLRNNEFYKTVSVGMSGTLLHASAAWGTRYFGLGSIGTGHYLSAPQLIVLSLEPDTELSMVAPADMEALHSAQGTTAVAAFGAYETTLGPADTLRLWPEDFTTSFAETEIVSSKPIAVFSYAADGRYPVDGDQGDGMYDQLLPTDAWGTEHMAVPVDAIYSNVDYNTWLIVASEPNTTVSFEGVSAPPIVLAAEGDSARVGDPSWTEAFRIVSDAPVGVMQFLDGGQAPSMTSVPPVAHLADRGGHFAHSGPDVYNVWMTRGRPSGEVAVAINGGALDVFSTYEAQGWTFDTSVPSWGAFALTHDGPFISNAWVTVDAGHSALFGSAYQID